MAWTSKAPADLPRVIAGPILRKVTNDSVSVFIVTSTNDPMVLKVYANTGTGNTVLLSSVSVVPYKIGNHVYVGMLTATSSTPQLDPNITYGYNIFWGTSQASHFGTNGILNDSGDTSIIAIDSIVNSFSINGNPIKLPTFVLPPADINDLWILHGSCRKAHGEGYDSMDGMTEVLELAVKGFTPISRPQILCLTGDQIYADDVADGLLHMINETIDSLMGSNGEGFIIPNNLQTLLLGKLQVKIKSIHNELNLPNTYGEEYDIANIFKPGYRGILLRELGFSVEEKDSKSHLTRLAEFEMMYLFYWSDVLWTNTLPSFKDVYKLLVNGVEMQVNDNQIVLGSIKGYDFKDDTEVVAKFKNEIGRLAKFRSTIPQVRKLLANIQTFMLLDDHEVTDDLFYNNEWFDNTKENGSYIIRNGLAAYTIFQAWGNDPYQFQNTGTPQQTVGSDFMDSIQNIANDINSGSAWLDIHEKLYPISTSESIGAIPSIGSYNTMSVVGAIPLSNPPAAANKILFDFIYTLDYLKFEIIGLDTRRTRASRKGINNFPGLISLTELTRQIRYKGNNRKDLTILLSAAPVLESKKFEESKNKFGREWYDPKYLPHDREPWNGDELFQYALFSELITRSKSVVGEHRVVVLCGDVHFSYSKSIAIKENTNFLETSLPSNSQLILASLCASSFKNQTNSISGTFYMHQSGPSENDNVSKVGFNNYAHNSFTANISNYPGTIGSQIIRVTDQSPHLHSLIYATNPYPINSTPPVDIYAFEEIYESGTSNSANFTLAVNKALEPMLSLLNVHKNHALEKSLLGGRWHVGKNNFGEVLFNWTLNNKHVQHNLYWREDDWADVLLPIIPSTGMVKCNASHIVPLNFKF